MRKVIQQAALSGLLAILSAAGGIIVLMDAPTVDSLKNKLRDLTADSEAIIAAADERGEDLTDDELAQVKKNKVEMERIGLQIEAREAVAPQGAPRPRTIENAAPAGGNGRPTVAAVPRRVDPRGGFQSLGEFASAVRQGSAQGAQIDNRLLAAATTFGTEGVGADGGFAVPTEYSREIWQKVMGEDSLATRCDQLVTGSNSMTLPKDETTPWQTSGRRAGLLGSRGGDGWPDQARARAQHDAAQQADGAGAGQRGTAGRRARNGELSQAPRRR
jgi:HK97 family phage major capsid protein